MNALLKVFTLAAAVLAIQSARADDAGGVNSEYFHQAASGKWEMSFGLAREAGASAWSNGDPNGLMTLKAKLRDSNSTGTLSFTPISVTGEYGLNDMFSLGLALISANGSVSVSNCGFATCSSRSLSGLFNPMIYLKGTSPSSAGAWVYGAVLDLAIDDGHVDTSGDGNNATGGSTLTPYVGWQMNAGAGVWGARFQYDLYKADTKTTSDLSQSSSTSSGGNKWTVDTFYEMGLGIWTLGGSAWYSQSTETQKTPAGGTASGQADANNILMFQIYAPVHLAQWTLLPNVQYGTLSPTQSTSTATSESILEVGLGARYAF